MRRGLGNMEANKNIAWFPASQKPSRRSDEWFYNNY
jgi:hypothetical protein